MIDKPNDSTAETVEPLTAEFKPLTNNRLIPGFLV